MANFPLWVRLTHFFNFMLLSLLVRSGIEIIGAHPKFYWNDHALPGKEWLRLTRKRMPKDELWTAEDEIQPYPSWAALPGRDNLGLGRHWHFFSVVLWLTCGALYVILLFATDAWTRLIPRSWGVFPAAWHVGVQYLTGHMPESRWMGTPFNALQFLAYFSVIFLLAPVSIVSGALMGPALGARFPRLIRVLRGHQGVRSIHFLAACSFLAFLVVHVTLVVLHGFGKGMARIVLGTETNPHHGLAIGIGLAGIALVVLVNVIANWYTLKHMMRAKWLLETGVDPLRKLLFHFVDSHESGKGLAPSPHARPNGRPPSNEQYQRHLASDFQDWTLEVGGLVERPLVLPLAELRAMPKHSLTSVHVCIQGWSYIAQWGGVRVSDLLDWCRPLPQARYLVFRTMDDKWENRPGGRFEVVDNGWYYEVIDLSLARRWHALLAYEMNHKPLPVAHGAPLRLRLDTQLGYKMAKWVYRIELVEQYADIGQGQGGWRDDALHYYVLDAGI